MRYYRLNKDAFGLKFLSEPERSNGLTKKNIQEVIEEINNNVSEIVGLSRYKIIQGEIYTIPVNYQMTVHGIFTLDGQLNIDGQLILGD